MAAATGNKIAFMSDAFAKLFKDDRFEGNAAAHLDFVWADLLEPLMNQVTKPCNKSKLFFMCVVLHGSLL